MSNKRGRGRLKPVDEFKIQKNFVFLLDNFDPTLDRTLEYMYKDEVFDDHDVDKVKNGGENTAKARAERFLDILKASGPEAYQYFLKALNETGFKFIAEKLEATDVSGVEAEGSTGWIDKLPEEMKQQTLNDADLSRLSVAFGKGWQSLFVELKFSQAQIEQAQMTNTQTPSGIITNLLIKWRYKHGSKAHLMLLLQAMQRVDADGRCLVDWSAVQEVIEGLKKKS